MRCVIKNSGNIIIENSEHIFAKEGYCVFDVKACGICGSDIPRAFYNGAYHYPLVVGHEFSGIVKDSTNSELIGKRACVFPILPCGECEFCKKQQWANCLKYDYYGSRRDGGMQSEVIIKEKNLVFLPDNVSYEAGAMIEPMAVCLHAVKKADINGESSVLVYGAGTIGLLSGMWAKALGAKNVFIKDIDEKRCRFAENLGFDTYDGEPVNVVIEASGAASVLNDAISKCEALGRILLIGHGKSDVVINHDVYVQILRKQLTLCGSWNSDFSDMSNDWRESILAISAGKINPEALITHKIGLSEADKAFQVSINRDEFSNKIMVVM